MNRQLRVLSLVLLCGVGVISCSPTPEGRAELPSAQEVDGGDASTSAHADRVEIVGGVPDRGRDPGVVAVSIGGTALCSGALVSPRLVLTARHCVSRTTESVMCPPDGVQVLRDHRPSELKILVGEDLRSAREMAQGVAIVAPAGVTLCDADVALVVLDQDVTLVKAMPIRSRGPTRGEHLRAVGFGKTGDDGTAGKKLVREHVRVLAVDAAEFQVGESTCQGDSGGPALDEETGEIVGVVSRGGPACEGADAHNIYTRIDAWAWLVEEAFTRAAEIARDGKADAGADAGSGVRPPPRGTKKKPASDLGGPCERASDCGAGVCLSDGSQEYCSRACGPGDRCPAHYHCEEVDPSGSACVRAD